MSEIDLVAQLGDCADALGRLLLERIAPFVRPWERAGELNATTTHFPLDPALAVALHPGRPAAGLTVGDREHDTGVPLALLDALAAARQPA